MPASKVEPAHGAHLNIQELVKNLDVNNDGIFDEEDKEIRNALIKMDADGDGNISIRELVKIGQTKVEDNRRINNMKKYLVVGGIVSLVFIALSLCSTIAAIEMTKETRAGGTGELLGKNNEPIMTAPTQDSTGSLISKDGKPVSVAMTTRIVPLSIDTDIDDLMNMRLMKYNITSGGEPAGSVGLKPVAVLKQDSTSVEIHCDGGWIVTMTPGQTEIRSPSNVIYGVGTTMRRRRGLLESTQDGVGSVSCSTDGTGACAKRSCTAGQYLKWVEDDKGNDIQVCHPCGPGSNPEDFSPPEWCECNDQKLKYDGDADECVPSSDTTPSMAPTPMATNNDDDDDDSSPVRAPTMAPTPAPSMAAMSPTPSPSTSVGPDAYPLPDNFPLKSINVTGADRSDGQVQFYKLLGGDCMPSTFDDAHPVHGFEAADGSFIFSGKGLDSGMKMEGFVVKMNNKGECVWFWTSGMPNMDDVINAAVQVNEANGDIFAVGYRNVTGSLRASVTRISFSTGIELWTSTDLMMELKPAQTPWNVWNGAWEMAEIASDGLLLGGFGGKPDQEFFFKSYGNSPGGIAVVMKIPFSSSSTGFPQMAQRVLTSADVAWTWTNIPVTEAGNEGYYLQACKAVRSMPNGDVAALFFTELATAPNSFTTVAMLDANGVPKWGPIELGVYGEGTDITSNRDGSAIFMSSLKKHNNGAEISAGLTKISADNGAVLFNNIYRSVPMENSVSYIQECWAVAGTPDGGAMIACGTGIEDCNGFNGTMAADCKAGLPVVGTDTRPGAIARPTGVWQSFIIRTDQDGNLLWQRVDQRRDPGMAALGQPGWQHIGSASEYVAPTSDGGYVCVQDEAAGVGILKFKRPS